MAYRRIPGASPQRYREYGIVHHEQVRAFRRGVTVGLLTGGAVALLWVCL